MDKKVRMVAIIDDDDVYRFTTEKYIQLMRQNIEVISFADGEEAFCYFKANCDNPENLPDVVLLDVNMPIMDGWDFLDEYEQMNESIDKDIRIFMVSSSTDDRDQIRCANYPSVVEYVVKPITEEYLTSVIKQ